MPDPIFADRRLAELYDPLDPDRGDLDPYLAMASEFGARSVLDVGCGTGVLACALARRGFAVVGVDPAEASLDIARAKPGADRVTWLLGDATTLPPLQVDLAVMTGNVAQVFLTDEAWAATLRGVRAALTAGARFAFETRVPEAGAWLEWNRVETHRRTDLPTAGVVEDWCEVTHLAWPLVTFRWTYVFERSGAVVTSDSTLRFRSRTEVESSLLANGFEIDDVRDAPDRPGREFVFVASPR